MRKPDAQVERKLGKLAATQGRTSKKPRGRWIKTKIKIGGDHGSRKKPPSPSVEELGGPGLVVTR